MNIDEAITEEIKRSVKGKTVLDVGGYNGADAHTAILAGASYAVCLDDGSWQTYDKWPDFTPFEDVQYVRRNFMRNFRKADIIIFKNVIYHQRNPWQSLEHLRTLTKEFIILATSYVEGDEPVWRVYAPFEGHPVSWTVAWRPTKSGLLKLLEATGFKDIEVLADDGGAIAIKAYPNPELPIGFGERN